jgi:glycolate oxidase FAD binding subunit
MPAAEAVERLGEALGGEGVEAGADCALEGVRPAATLHPRDAAELARAVKALGALRLAALVRGGGTRLELGNPPRRADVVLSTRRIAGLEEFDPGEGVCRVRAGTALADLRAAVNAGGWELPLDAPGRGSTVGGTLAAAAVGPRALGFGLPRDLVLGLEVVLGDGTRTRCGGRVVKNVTGYDLAKLYTGSLGTLGVIAAAWVRLRPRPERVAVLEAGVEGVQAACALGLAAARGAMARAAALVLPSPRGPGSRSLGPDAEGRACLVVELAGDAPAVDRDAAWLAAEAGAREAAAEALDRVRRLQADAPGAGGLRFRLAVRPSRLPAAAAALGAAGASLLLYPGLGLAYAGFPLGADAVGAGRAPDPALDAEAPGAGDAASRAFAAVARAAGEAGGSWVLERGPLLARRGRDAFGEAPALLPLTRALKARFDPAGVLNPGRYLGGV